MDNGFKQRIQERLEALELTAWSASKKAGFDKNYISDILNDRKGDIRAANMKRLAAALETTTYWLQTAEGNHTKTSSSVYEKENVRLAVQSICHTEGMVNVDPDAMVELIMEICDYLQSRDDAEGLDNVVQFATARLKAR